MAKILTGTYTPGQETEGWAFRERLKGVEVGSGRMEGVKELWIRRGSQASPKSTSHLRPAQGLPS